MSVRFDRISYRENLELPFMQFYNEAFDWEILIPENMTQVDLPQLAKL